MASKNTNKTIITLGVMGILIFLAVKLWPAIKKRIAGSGSGSTAVPGSIPSAPYYQQQPYQQQPQGPSLSAGFGGGAGSGAGNILSNFLRGIANYNAETMPGFNQLQADTEEQIQSSTDDDFIPYEPLENMTDLPSFADGTYLGDPADYSDYSDGTVDDSYVDTSSDVTGLDEDYGDGDVDSYYYDGGDITGLDDSGGDDGGDEGGYGGADGDFGY